MSLLNDQLFLTDLDRDVDELRIKDWFSKQGYSLNWVELARHWVTRESLGYAFLSFSNESEAEKALKALRFPSINLSNMPSRLMKRNPKSHKGPAKANLFVKNISSEIDNRKLFGIFSFFGDVISSKIEYNSNGKHAGFGYVQFNKVEDASDAIKTLNGTKIAKKKVTVCVFMKYRERQDKLKIHETRKFTNVYIQNLNKITREIQFHDIVELFGHVSKHKLLPKEGSAMCGLVAFENYKGAQKCVNKLNGCLVNGSTIVVEKRKSKTERARELERKFNSLQADGKLKYKNTDVYVSNLDPDVTERTLKREFLSLGNLINAKIMKYKKFYKVGFGDWSFTVEHCALLQFSTSVEAAVAVHEMQGVKIGSKHINLTLSSRIIDRSQNLTEKKGRIESSQTLPEKKGKNPPAREKLQKFKFD